MPLRGPSSYPETLQSFLAHWAAVNTRLGAGHELVLRGGLDLAGAQALEAEAEALIAAARNAAQDVLLAGAELAARRSGVRARLEQFAGLARAYWAGTPWGALAPNLPPLLAATDKFLLPVRDALRLWALLEAEPPPPGAPMPITLDPGGAYGRADFAAEAEGARLAALAAEDARWARAVALARRDAALLRARTALKDYTRAAAGRLPPGDALLGTMPALWPPPGHTPEPVALTAGWAADAAVFTWEASADALLDHYELRGCPGPEYDTEAERAVARAAKDAPREITTAALLGAPGAVAAFRLYVVLETGNERGSPTAVVARPG